MPLYPTSLTADENRVGVGAIGELKKTDALACCMSRGLESVEPTGGSM